MKDNQFGCRLNFESSEGKTALYSLEKLQKDGIGTIDRLPFSIRILLEQAHYVTLMIFRFVLKT